MSELSGYDCPRCNSELFIEASPEVDGVDLLICKQCWGVAVTAKSMEMVITKGSLLDEKRDKLSKSSGDCKCPICSDIMDEIELDIPKEVIQKISLIESQVMAPEKVIIDSCKNCPTFWFDAGELDLLNGIKPKIRKNDPKTIRLLEDQTLSADELSKRGDGRRIIGGFAILGAFLIGSEGGFFLGFISLIMGIGGLIALVTKNPEEALVKGTCDKCLKPDKLLAWNCQSGGCWAHICSDCQSIGEDPVEAYARTLGKVAVGTVIVGVGVLAVLAVAEGGGAGLLDGVSAPSGSGKKKEKTEMLLCRECTEREKNNLKSLKKKSLKTKNPEKTDMSVSSKESRKNYLSTTWSPETKNEYCTHIDLNNNKKCKRMSFRSSNYCYVHKDLY